PVRIILELQRPWNETWFAEDQSTRLDRTRDHPQEGVDHHEPGSNQRRVFDDRTNTPGPRGRQRPFRRSVSKLGEAAPLCDGRKWASHRNAPNTWRLRSSPLSSPQ